MKLTVVALPLVLGGVAAASPADAATSVLVLPGTVTPGEQVSVFGTSCPAFTGTASSTAFSSSIHLIGLSNTTGGVGSISAKASPGTYTVTVACGSKTFTGSVTVVVSSSTSASVSTSPSPSPSHSASATASSASPSASASATAAPSGGAATGDGSSLGGTGSGGLEAGAVTLAAGGLLGVVEMRRRRAGARH